MREIRPWDYVKVVGTCMGCLLFVAMVIALEWHRAEPAAKIVVLSLFAFFLLLSVRAMVIYRPQRIAVSSLKVLRGPYWSSTILDVHFVWVEADIDGKRKRVRLVG